MVVSSDVSNGPPAKQTEWNSLAQKARRYRFGIQAALLGVMTIVTAPVIVPFIWLITISLTDSSGGRIDTQTVWYVLAVSVPVIFVLGVFNSYFPDARYRKRVNLLAMLAAVFGMYKIFEGKLHLENFGFFSSATIDSITRNGGYPTVWVPLINSLTIAISVTILVVIVATLAGYFISRFNFRGRKQCLQALIILHSFPAHSLTIPIFLLMFWLGLLDRSITVVFVLTALELPFAIYIIKGFFDGVPWSIEMSAMTDGATRFQAFYKVVLPMVKNGALAIAVFAFIRGWGEYIFVTTLMISNENWMMSTYIFVLADETKDVDYGLLAAVSVIYLLPTLIMYLLAQKQLSQLNISGVKG